MISPGFIALLAGISVFCLLYAIYAPIKTITEVHKQRTTTEELAELEAMGSGAKAFDKYIRPMLRNFLPQSPISVSLSSVQKSKITELIIRSGNPWGLRAEEFRGTQILLGVIGLFVGILLAATSAIPNVPPIIFIFLLPIMGILFPFSTYNTAREKRIKEVNRQLPEALDLIRVSMSAGNKFPIALQDVTPRLEEGVLKLEFSKLSEELRAGVPLSVALTHLSRRAPSDEVDSFCKAINQGETLGVAIDSTLKSQADMARRNYEAILDAKIAKLPSRMFLFLIPTMLPAIIIIFVGPAGQQLMGIM